MIPTDPIEGFMDYEKIYAYLKEHYPDQFRVGESITDTVIRLLDNVQEYVKSVLEYHLEQPAITNDHRLSDLEQQNKDLKEMNGYLRQVLRRVL